MFVYGSLKRGFQNNPLLGTATFVAEDRLLDHKMFSLGGYPGIIYYPNKNLKISGELFVVDSPTLTRLDQLEGHPNHYERKFLTLASGRRAWTYIYKQDTKSRPVMEDGNWVMPESLKKFWR